MQSAFFASCMGVTLFLSNSKNQATAHMEALTKVWPNPGMRSPGMDHWTRKLFRQTAPMHKDECKVLFLQVACVLLWLFIFQSKKQQHTWKRWRRSGPILGWGWILGWTLELVSCLDKQLQCTTFEFQHWQTENVLSASGPIPLLCCNQSEGCANETVLCSRCHEMGMWISGPKLCRFSLCKYFQGRFKL